MNFYSWNSSFYANNKTIKMFIFRNSLLFSCQDKAIAGDIIEYPVKSMGLLECAVKSTYFNKHLVMPLRDQKENNTITLHKKMEFSMKDFFSKCDPICWKLRIWSHLLKKSLMENFSFCAVLVSRLALSLSW